MKKYLLALLLLLAPVAASAAVPAITPVAVGTTAGDGTGDTLRNSFVKINTNTANLLAPFTGTANTFMGYDASGNFLDFPLLTYNNGVTSPTYGLQFSPGSASVAPTLSITGSGSNAGLVVAPFGGGLTYAFGPTHYQLLNSGVAIVDISGSNFSTTKPGIFSNGQLTLGTAGTYSGNLILADGTASSTGSLTLAPGASTTSYTLKFPPAACATVGQVLAFTDTAGTLGCGTVTGGGGSTAPGGSNGALQYNNSGAFAGAVITGLVKGNGTAAPAAAVAGTDYQAPITGTSGTLARFTGTNTPGSDVITSDGAGNLGSVVTLTAASGYITLNAPSGVILKAAGSTRETCNSAGCTITVPSAAGYVTTPVTLSGATPAIVATNGAQTITLSANATPTVSGIATGQRITFEICQPASGGPYTWTWPAAFHGGMTIGTTASTCSEQSFDSFNGTTFVPESVGISGVAP